GTKAVARTHQRSRIPPPPGSFCGPARTGTGRACRSETRRGLRGPSARLPETLERRDDRPQPIPEVCRRQELLMAITIPAARYTSSAFAALENDRLWPRVWV